MIILMALLLSAVAIITGYAIYNQDLERQTIKLGQGMARSVANILRGDKISVYLETLSKDAVYEGTLNMLKTLREDNGLKYLYVETPTEEGMYFIFDASEGTDDEEAYELGYLDPWDENYPEFKRQILNGGPVDPIVSNTWHGWLLSVYEPIKGSDGKTKAYVGADFGMEEIIKQRAAYLLRLVIVTLLTTAVLTASFLYVIRKTVVLPISILTKAAGEFFVSGYDSQTETSSISSMTVDTRDELHLLSEAMKSMERNINEHIKSLNLITAKAETDALTNLWNRDTFRNRVELHLRDKVSTGDEQMDAFLMIDIDYFKSVNDTYGHTAGDEVLAACAAALRRALRGSDIVARQGGDEFVAFCKSIGDAHTAESKARQIREEWLRIIPNGGDKPVTGSIGIALSPRDGVTFDELYAKSDKALYRAKEDGRDRFVLFEG